MRSDVDKLYNDGFFKGRHRYHWRAPIVCASIVKAMQTVLQIKAETAVDVGCATGDLVQGFVDLGLGAYGIEASRAVIPHLVCHKEHIAFHDLRDPLPEDSIRWAEPGKLVAEVVHFPSVDVATCFEVAEHLEPEYADTFVETLTKLSNVLVISTAGPDPRGKPPTKYHQNEQPPEYWYEKFAKHAFVRHRELENVLRTAWHPWRHKYGIAAFWQNLRCLVWDWTEQKCGA